MTFKDFLKEVEGADVARGSPFYPDVGIRSSRPPQGRLTGTRWLDAMRKLPADQRPKALWMWMQSEQAQPGRDEFMQMLELMYQDWNGSKGVQ